MIFKNIRASKVSNQKKKTFKIKYKVYLKWWVISCIALFLLFFFIIYFLNLLSLSKETLYWLFSASAQSMAAIFGVLGMFAVFRFQILNSKLKNLYDTLRFRFKQSEWIYFYGIIHSECWIDSEVLTKTHEQLKRGTDQKFPQPILEDLHKRISEINKFEQSKIDLLSYFIIPMFVIILAFLFSITGILFCPIIENKFIGFIVLVITMMLILISIITGALYIFQSILSYLISSLENVPPI